MIVMVAASVSGSEAVFVNSGAVVVVGVGRAHEPGHRVSVARGLWNSVVGAGWLAEGGRIAVQVTSPVHARFLWQCSLGAVGKAGVSAYMVEGGTKITIFMPCFKWTKTREATYMLYKSYSRNLF